MSTFVSLMQACDLTVLLLLCLLCLLKYQCDVVMIHCRINVFSGIYYIQKKYYSLSLAFKKLLGFFTEVVQLLCHVCLYVVWHFHQVCEV